MKEEKNEIDIMKKIMLAVSKIKDALIFRINVGQAWTGEKIIKLNNGDIIIKKPRPFRTGVPRGFSDLFGIKKIKITPKMVGKEIAVFFAIEVKTEKGKPSEYQVNFIKNINELGGDATIQRCDKEAKKHIEGL